VTIRREGGGQLALPLASRGAQSKQSRSLHLRSAMAGPAVRRDR
jgi:hypothetical protein